MSKKTIISLIILACTILFSVWAYVVSSNLTRDVARLSTQGKVENEKLNVNELMLTETRNGAKYWEVYAQNAKYESLKSVAVLKDVTGNFYKNGKVIMSFKSPKALYEDKSKKVTLVGGATAITDSQVVINASQIGWAGKSEAIVASNKVRIVKPPKFVLNTDKAIFKTDMSDFKMFGNSQTRVY